MSKNRKNAEEEVSVADKSTTADGHHTVEYSPAVVVTPANLNIPQFDFGDVPAKLKHARKKSVLHSHSCSDGESHKCCHDHRHDYFSLCTKCMTDSSSMKKENENRSSPGFIIQSKSFKTSSNALRWAYDSAFSASCDNLKELPKKALTNKDGSPLFDRSRIIVETSIADGSNISDIYDLNVGKLGKGSYGSVVKARDKRTGLQRAVKIVNKEKIENIGRLKREILIMKRIDHPNIIKLFEVYEDSTNLYLVMEICTGGELFDRIIKSSFFSERYASALMRQVFSATAYCHYHNIIHRDLKPENLLYADTSPLSLLKVIDWGFAAKCGRNHRFSSVVGTPYYVAPEVLFGNYDQACDLWSSGVILYILLCGYPPFHGSDNKQILKKVQLGEYHFDHKHWDCISSQAKDLISRCLTYDPRKRITAQEALSHPWIVQYGSVPKSVDSPITPKMSNALMEKFKKFQTFNKMKRLAVTCIAYQLSEKDIGQLYDIFASLDTNGDGILSIAEISQGLQQTNTSLGEEAWALLSQLDTDGSGSIDYTEFIAATISQKLYEQESSCRAAFRIFDLDGDGKITIDELHHVLGMSSVRESFEREMVEDIINEVDTNKDGSIDFDEFMKMMRGKQKKGNEKSSRFSMARSLFYRKTDS